MNTLIAVSIAPVGQGEHLSSYVAEIVKTINDSGLPTQTYSMFTEIEGDWDEVMAAVKKATEVLTNQGIRTIVSLKADIRPGQKNRMEGKLDSLNAKLKDLE